MKMENGDDYKTVKIEFSYFKQYFHAVIQYEAKFAAAR